MGATPRRRHPEPADATQQPAAVSESDLTRVHGFSPENVRYLRSRGIIVEAPVTASERYFTADSVAAAIETYRPSPTRKRKHASGPLRVIGPGFGWERRPQDGR